VEEKMSIAAYKQAKERILNNESLADFCGHVSDELIALAEEKLSLKVTGSYLNFLQTFGTLCYVLMRGKFLLMERFLI
jgi:antitoxin YobK